MRQLKSQLESKLRASEQSFSPDVLARQQRASSAPSSQDGRLTHPEHRCCGPKCADRGAIGLLSGGPAGLSTAVSANAPGGGVSRESSRGSSHTSSRNPTPPPSAGLAPAPPPGGSGSALAARAARVTPSRIPGPSLAVDGPSTPCFDSGRSLAAVAGQPSPAPDTPSAAASAGGGGGQHPRGRPSPQRPVAPSSSTSSRSASRTSRPASASRSRPQSGSHRPCLSQLATLQGGSEQPLLAIVVSEDGSGLIAGGMDGQLELWSLSDDASGLGTTTRSAASWRRTLTQPVGGGEINGLALLGSILACGCQDGSVRLFRLLKEAGSFVLYSLLRKHHTVSSSFVVNGGDGAGSGAAGTGMPSEVMCVALSAAHSSKNAPLLASGAQVRRLQPLAAVPPAVVPPVSSFMGVFTSSVTPPSPWP